MAICGKCGQTQTVEEIRRCFSALPDANVIVDEYDQGLVGKQGSNFYLREQNQRLYDQHQADIAYDEANPLVQNFPPSLRSQRVDLPNATYDDRQVVKAAGARWDPVRKIWYCEGEVPEVCKKFLHFDDPNWGSAPAVHVRQGADLIKREGAAPLAEASMDSSSGQPSNPTDSTALRTTTEPGRTESGEAFFDEPKEHKHVFKSVPVKDGYFKLDGTIYMSQLNQAETAYYTKRLAISYTGGEDGNEPEGSWEYHNVYRQLKEEHRLTLEEAKEFGSLYGVCCRCGRRLTNETSKANGIGPICEGKFEGE